MIKLEPIAPPIQLRRAWTIFFSEGEPGFWRWFTRRGFRHVEAAAYFADQDRWVFVIPSRRRLVIEVKRAEEAGPLFASMVASCTVAIRFEGQEARAYAPLLTGCVGTVKGLCGLKSRALWPHHLFRDLLRQGAEIVHGRHIRIDETPGGRSGGSAIARGRAEACGAGSHQGDPGTAFG